MNKIQVRRTGRTWGVFMNGILHEGGFFGRQAAETCAYNLRGETLIPVADLGVCEHGYAQGCRGCDPDGR